MQNRDKFYAVAGKEVVDYKLDNSIMGATMALTHWRPGMGQTFDEKRNEELIGYLLSVDYAEFRQLWHSFIRLLISGKEISAVYWIK